MDFNDMNDPDLRAAIEASLRDVNGSENNSKSTPKKQNQHVVDLTAESDDEVTEVFPKSNSTIGFETDEDEEGDGDLKRAIEMSMQGTGEDDDLIELPNPPKEEDHNSASKPPSNDASAQKSEVPRPMGLLGLDRKAMEEERLARLAKRKASDPSALEQPRSKHLKTEDPRKGESDDEVQPKEQVLPSNKPGIQFPNGAVKKTWAFSCPRTGDDIKIEEVFQQSDLKLAVLSSFMWDTEWLFSKVDIFRTRFLLVMEAKEESTKRRYEEDTRNMETLRLCFPPMEAQVNCMHSKLMLLFHPDYVRIVVPTANLTPYDWGEKGGIMENSVFLIDLPKKVEGASETSRTPFYEELVHFLRASTLHEKIITRLDGFDFSKTGHLAFIHTIGGSHVNDAWRRTGYCGLGRAVSSLGLRSSSPMNIDFVTSSVGSLTEEFLRSMYLAAQGDDGLTEFTLRTAKSFPAKRYNDPGRLIQGNTAGEWTNRFRVYFPSQDVVQDSKGGPRNAGTICFQEKWYEGAKFPRHVLRECRSQRPALLMHNKILYVRPDEPISMPDNSRCRAWAYVGSANLSESAWGRLVQDRSTKKPKLNCRNWECGVLFPVIDKAQDSTQSSTQSKPGNALNRTMELGESANALDVFKGAIPVPVQLPGRRFGPNLRPWYFSF
ncbi:tyrosyl-DNA phosphodiesterase domain-containing protein [Aspergillus sclerotialis]|uniref:Tyrosyl-DNA phosphodiesterase domain-containing protein n=1 Tax=Aspergillus sclerotialis TaxID=2070753 RepID=A0A3A2ZR92_9EURO|nr:tyrosyl-DNA phosphodiesterase domain-containing protein [Aspergillus sclerotialis]